MYKFITLTNGKKVQAFYESEEDQVAEIVGAAFDFKTLSDGKLVQKIAFVDAAGDKVELFIVPFKADLDTWYKTITDKIFAEQIENLPGKFLPRVASFVAANSDNIDTGIDLSSAAIVDITVICYHIDGDSVIALQGDSFTNRVGLLWHTDNIIYVLANNGGTTQYATIEISPTGWYKLRFLYDNSGSTNPDKLKLFIDDIEQTLSYAGTIPATLGVMTSKFNLGFNNPGTTYMTGLISYASISKDGATASQYYPTGQGDYEYDVSENENHGTWAGTGDRFAYDLEGSDYPNVNGYSLWEHATSDPIQVPYDLDGNAISLTPGTDIPTGYTKTRDVEAVGSKWNMADSKYDFDPDVGTDPAIDLLDRSNVTIQTAASRASDYYNVGTPYQYHVDEISDPRIYDTFFEAAYKDRWFAKVVLDGTDLICWDEGLNYGTVKAGADLVTVEEYCGIDSIYPV